MNQEIIRIAFPEDEPSLKALWKTCFHDSDEDIDRFFNNLYKPESTIVGTVDNVIASMAHLLYPGDLITNSGTFAYSMIYAVGTYDDYRGKGLASRETCAAVFQGFGFASPVATLAPANDGLFDFYRDNAGFSDFFYAAENTLSTAYNDKAAALLKKTTPGEYASLRERLLTGRTHTALNQTFLDYADQLLTGSGGGLFVFPIKDSMACAAVEISGDTAAAKELICPVGLESSAAEFLSCCFKQSQLKTITPVDKDHCFGTLIRTAMAVSDGTVDLLRDINALPWYGLTFD